MLQRPTYVNEIIEDAANEEISYRNLHSSAHICKKNGTKDIKIPYTSLTNKYKEYLKHIIIELPLEDDEAQVYQMRPKLLSENLYGTTELWYTILELNGIRSIIDFNINKVKVYDPTKFQDLFNEILILEGVLK